MTNTAAPTKQPRGQITNWSANPVLIIWFFSLCGLAISPMFGVSTAGKITLIISIAIFILGVLVGGFLALLEYLGIVKH
jgi:hypothetical protein